jgi:hypothetical protein
MHNCHLQFLHTQDDSLLRRIYQLLKKSIHLILHRIRKESLPDGNYCYHLAPAMQGEESKLVQDSIQLLTLLHWGLAALLDSARRLKMAEPELEEWLDVLTHLAPLPSDNRIGLIRPTSNYHPADHMCAIYPIHLLSIHNPEQKKLIDTTLDYWLGKTENLPLWDKEGGGFRLTHGAACLAAAGRGDDAWRLLQKFMHVRMTANTMYREGDNPTLETPLAGAAALYEMLLQSWGGILRIFPAIPADWKDCSFRTLRAEGAFLVSADRRAGKTTCVAVQSLDGGIVELLSNIPMPRIVASKKAQVVNQTKDSLRISFEKGATIVIQ